MKIDWKKELKFPSLSGRGKPSIGKPSAGRPSIGGPDLRMPKVLSDLYADLRDRRLLPLVALLIVAIIAAPILLNKGSHEEEPALTPAVAAGAEASDANFAVVPAGPGLRDYKKRLRHRTALNPFRRPPEHKQAQAKSGSPSAASASESVTTGIAHGSPEPTATIRIGGVTQEVPASSVETVTPEETTKTESTRTESSRTESTKTETGTPGSTEVESSSSSETSAPPATEATEAPPASIPPATSSPEGTVTESTETKSKPTETKSKETVEAPIPQSPATGGQVVGYAIDAEAGFVPHTTEKTELAPMTRLPNAKHPLVLYMGLSKNHKRALFLMTSNVTAYYGGHCALDKASCQLVEVQAGKGITFVNGYGESRYKVHLKRIVPVRRFSK